MSARELPPSLAGLVEENAKSRNRHDRSRVRMELSEVKARIVMDLLKTKLDSINIRDAQFGDVYQMYNHIREQIEKGK